MADITLQHCHELRKEFESYCDTAEQHEFPLLFMVDMKMQNTLKHYESIGSVDDQKEAHSMVRVVSKVIGNDYYRQLGEEHEDKEVK